MSWIKSDDDGWWENNRTSKMSTTSVWKFLGSNKMLFVVIALRFFSNYGVCRVLLLPIMLFCICWALKVKRWTWERTKLLVILNLSMFFLLFTRLLNQIWSRKSWDMEATPLPIVSGTNLSLMTFRIIRGTCLWERTLFTLLSVV